MGTVKKACSAATLQRACEVKLGDLCPRRAKRSQQSIYRTLCFLLNKGRINIWRTHCWKVEEKKEAWVAVVEVIEDNLPSQHPLILVKLFLYRFLASCDTAMRPSNTTRDLSYCFYFHRGLWRLESSFALGFGEFHELPALPLLLMTLAPDVECEKLC